MPMCVHMHLGTIGTIMVVGSLVIYKLHRIYICV